MMAGDEFLKLKREWYRRLKESGFEDIEYANGSLKKEVDSCAEKRALEEREARIAYFDKAQDVLHNTPWASEENRKVWELHCEGVTVRLIAKALKMRPATVQWRIKQIRLRAGIKKH